MRPGQQIAINGATGSANSGAIDAKFMLGCSVIVAATGTLAGAVKIQVANVANTPASGDWIDLPSATVTLTGTAGNFLIGKQDVCFQWIRLVFTASGGSGTATAYFKSYGF